MDQPPEENPNREKAKESASDLQDDSKRKISLPTSEATGVASSYIDAQESTFSGSSNFKASESIDNDSTEDAKLSCPKTRSNSFHAQASTTSSGSSNSKDSESRVHDEAGDKTILHQKPNGDAKNKRIPSPIPDHAFRAFELLRDAVGSLVSNKNLWDEVVEKRVKEISKKLNDRGNANNSGQGTKTDPSTKNQSEELNEGENANNSGQGTKTDPSTKNQSEELNEGENANNSGKGTKTDTSTKNQSEEVNEDENPNNSGQGTKADISTKMQSEGENPSKRPQNGFTDLMRTTFEVFQGIFGTQFPTPIVIFAISIIVMCRSRNCNAND